MSNRYTWRGAEHPWKLSLMGIPELEAFLRDYADPESPRIMFPDYKPVTRQVVHEDLKNGARLGFKLDGTPRKPRIETKDYAQYAWRTMRRMAELRIRFLSGERAAMDEYLVLWRRLPSFARWAPAWPVEDCAHPGTRMRRRRRLSKWIQKQLQEKP